MSSGVRRDWMNFQHLLYFVTVAREGSMMRAARRLFVTQPTLSNQIRTLEQSLGEDLFERKGRRLELTDAGRVVLRYAEEMFGLGDEMRAALRGGAGAPRLLRVGISEGVPKAVAHRLLQPLTEAFQGLVLHCGEDRGEDLPGHLAAFRYDVLITDAPLPQEGPVRFVTHPLGKSPVAFFALPGVARRLAKDFPQSLDGLPFLLPAPPSSLRHALEYWFRSKGVRPRLVGEFEDGALLKVFAAGGLGAMAASSLAGEAVRQRYGLEVFGKTEDVAERYFVIMPQRRVTHPAAALLVEKGRRWLHPAGKP